MKQKAVILGTGNVGTDLLIKILNRSDCLEAVLFAGIDPLSEGIARARSLGVPVSDDGIDAVLEDPAIRIVFDATSAQAHLRHAPRLKEAGKAVVDMTPAAVGPYCVPVIGMKLKVGDAANVNMSPAADKGRSRWWQRYPGR